MDLRSDVHLEHNAVWGRLDYLYPEDLMNGALIRKFSRLTHRKANANRVNACACLAVLREYPLDIALADLKEAGLSHGFRTPMNRHDSIRHGKELALVLDE